jgi:hypothetical protein
MTLTTYFDTPPLPGVSHVLQFVKTDDTEAEGNVATESYVDNAVSVLQGEIDTIVAASDVRDIVGTHADLEAYDTSTLGDNDIIKVLVDETEDDKTSYYRWSTSTEEFALIGTLGPFQGVLTAGANITIDANNEISAIDTTYTAGTNITIDSNNVISATDTTYSDFVGTDGQDAGTAGLVPAPAATDADKFLKSDGTWAEAGGSSTLYTTYGQNTDGAMTQKATTDLVYTAGDPKKINIGDNGVTGGTNSIIIGSEDSGTITAKTDQIIIGHNVTDKYSDTVAIGHNAVAGGQHSVVVGQGSVSAGESVAIGYFAASNQGGIGIGKSAAAGSTSVVIGTQQFITSDYKQRFIGIGGYLENSNDDSVAIGYGSGTVNKYSVALGYAAYTRDQGVVDVSTSASRYGGNYGYQGANDQARTNLRVISGVHDGEQLHGAATVAQGNTLATSAPTTTTAGVLGQLYTDTTAMHTYQCTAIDTTDSDNPVYTWTQRW